MKYDLIDCQYKEGYRLYVRFSDGKGAEIDLVTIINSGPIFEALKDINYFQKVSIHPELKTLCWPNGADIAPETLYHWATGEPLPSWLEPD